MNGLNRKPINVALTHMRRHYAFIYGLANVPRFEWPAGATYVYVYVNMRVQWAVMSEWHIGLVY